MAKGAPLIAEGHRQRFACVRPSTASTHPDQVVRHQHLGVRAALPFRGQRQVDVAPVERFEQPGGGGADQRDADPRPCLMEALEHGRHERRDDVVGYAQPHLALEIGRRHQPPYLVVEGEQSLRMGEQPLPLRRQPQPAAVALEQ